MRIGALVRRGDERGAVLLLFTILLSVFFIILAIVVDLGFVRYDTRDSQSVADFAAMAGAFEMDPLFGGTPLDGCEAAWDYFIANTPGVPADAPNNCVAAFGSLTTCDPATPVEAVQTVGPYTVTITIPVPDDSPLMGSTIHPEIDGTPCQRIGLDVQRTREHGFAPVIGATSGSSTRSAVARTSSRTNAGDAVSLILLDPTGCKALIGSGQAKVHVFGGGTTESPGVITVDSAGTEQNSTQARNCKDPAHDFTIDAVGTQNSAIKACGNTLPLTTTDPLPCEPGGIIFSHALVPGNGTAFSYEELDVTDVRLYPRPVPGERVKRTPVDHRYDCKGSYPTYYGLTIEPCRDPAGAPHITQLRQTVQETGVPAGFSTYAGPCQTQSTDPAIALESGKWFIDCEQFIINNSVTIRGGEIVFRGTVDVRGGELCINVGSGTCGAPAPTDDAWVYLRKDAKWGGNFLKGAQARITLAQTMVHITDGYVSFGAGSGALIWNAPIGGNFEDLALWSEGPYAHLIGGQAALALEGAFFTPYAAPFEFKGQGDYLQTKAQFISFRIELSGQGNIAMQADPERVILIPLQGVRLIR